jgi:hypothetical protein
MSFPDWYEFLGGLTQGRVQTGDAVPPLLAKAVAGSIADSLAGKTAESDSDLDVVHVKTVKENLNPKTK